MLYIALAEAAVIAVLCVTFAGLLRAQIRQAARREDLLVNQLCNLAGRPWQEAPALQASEPEPDLEFESLAAPEQYAY